MDLWKIKLSQLRALLAVAEQGNFSEAALTLGMSQSTISHAIATLEDELGVVLFHRGRHGAQLTPVGEQVAAHARHIQGSLEAILATANQERGLQGGTVRIAAFRSIATHVLPGAIAHLHRRYPHIQVVLTEVDELHQLKQALLQGQVDVCVAEILEGEEFETQPLLQDVYIALLPPNSGLRNAKLTLGELTTYPLIISSHGSCADRIQRYLKKQQPDLNVSYRIRHDSSMTSMVQQGLGIAIMPRLAAEPIPDGVQVCCLPFHLARPIGVSRLGNSLAAPAVYAFLTALQDTVSSSLEVPPTASLP
jgi:DNA-binding transcriptional LysR family regulator